MRRILTSEYVLLPPLALLSSSAPALLPSGLTSYPDKTTLPEPPEDVQEGRCIQWSGTTGASYSDADPA